MHSARFVSSTTRLSSLLALVLLLTSGCVYQIDVQQGNLLDESAVEAVQVGMTRSQVRFLLGTPVVDDPFRADRWDYMYYLRKGRAREPEQRWLIVHFEGERVSDIEQDVPIRRGRQARRGSGES